MIDILLVFSVFIFILTQWAEWWRLVKAMSLLPNVLIEQGAFKWDQIDIKTTRTKCFNTITCMDPYLFKWENFIPSDQNLLSMLYISLLHDCLCEAEVIDAMGSTSWISWMKLICNELNINNLRDISTHEIKSKVRRPFEIFWRDNDQ